MNTLHPVAQHLLKQNGGNDHGDAWRAAILRERKLCGKDSCRDTAAILVRHFAFNFSTSSVERLLLASIKTVFQSISHHVTTSHQMNNTLRFSKSVWMNGTQRGDVGMDLLNDELRVAFLEVDEVPEAIDLAQHEWVARLDMLKPLLKPSEL